MIDTSLLNQLFDDQKMIRKYLEVFRNDAPNSLGELRSSIENSEWESASISAHSLKSQLQYLNEKEAAEIAYKMEKLCSLPLSEIPVKVLKELLLSLEICIGNVLAKIDKHLK